MRVPFSYLDRQFANDGGLTAAILADIANLAQTADFTLGDPVTEFERRARDFFGVQHVLGVNSGTQALELIMQQVLHLQPGDEVITVPNTFYATAATIATAGGSPVYVDVDDTYSIDVAKVEAAITKRTRAILPVHWYGMPADMDPLLEIAHRHGLLVIEDACASIGARYKGVPVGAIGDLAAVSLHPLKTLHVWGDGGALLTDRPDWAVQLALYRNHGMVDRDHISLWGTNARLHSIQAAVANRQFPLMERWTAQRNVVAAKLDAGLADVDGITLPPRHADRLNAYQLYVIQAERRTELLTYLDEHGVEAKVHYPIPLHLQPVPHGRPYQRGDFPVAEAQAARIVSLPCNQYLRDEEIDYMIETIRRFYAR